MNPMKIICHVTMLSCGLVPILYFTPSYLYSSNVIFLFEIRYSWFIDNSVVIHEMKEALYKDKHEAIKKKIV